MNDALMKAWQQAPYDPKLAVDLAETLPERAAEKILQRQAAYDPNLHLLVDDYFRQPDGQWGVFCTQGHGFFAASPDDAWRLGEDHLEG